MVEVMILFTTGTTAEGRRGPLPSFEVQYIYFLIFYYIQQFKQIFPLIS